MAIRITVHRNELRVTQGAIPVNIGGGSVTSVDGQTGAVDLSSDYQPLDSTLTDLAALSPTVWGKARLEDADRAAAMLALGQTVAAVTAGSNSSDTTGVAFAAMSLAVGTYRIMATLSVSSDAGATAMNLRWTGSGGLVATGAMSFFQPGTANADSSPTLDSWTGFTSGVGTAQRSILIEGVVVVTTSGTLTLEFRSETNLSAVNIHSGVLVTHAL